jgi:serine O-acetyltransferase
MKFHALAHWLWKRHVPLLPALLCGINRVVFSVNLPAQTQIGRGTVLKHNGLGVVIHRRAVIGQRVFINPGAVIGGRAGH